MYKKKRNGAKKGKISTVGGKAANRALKFLKNKTISPPPNIHGYAL